MSPIIDEWSLESIQSDRLVLNLEINEPYSVSTVGEDKDLLLVQIELNLFTSKHGRSLPASLVKYSEIPTQMKDKEEANAVNETGSAAGGSSTSALLLEVFLNLLIVGSLDPVW